jgi:hypothetical protein
MATMRPSKARRVARSSRDDRSGFLPHCTVDGVPYPATGPGSWLGKDSLPPLLGQRTFLDDNDAGNTNTVDGPGPPP